MKVIQTIIMTSDKYLPALRPFMWLWNRYAQFNLPQRNIICGFSPPDFPLLPNFEFYSVGKFEDYPIGKWSDQLIHVLNEVADDIFILMLEDYWIVRHVDTGAVEMLYRYADQFRYVLKIDLCSDRLYAQSVDKGYGIVDRVDLIKSMPGSPYHFSFMAGIWNRELLKKIIIPDETPWDIEMAGTHRLSLQHSDMLVLGTRQMPLKHLLAFRSGEVKATNFETLESPLDVRLKIEDVREMRGLGLLKGME